MTSTQRVARHLFPVSALVVVFALGGCSSEPGPVSGGSGGASGGAESGGAPSAGGAPAGGASSGGASSGGETAAGGSSSGGSATGGSSGGEFTLTSAEFEDGEEIPAAHTCEGGGGQMNWGQAPSLKWENPPEGTMSYAFFMIDETLTTKQPPDVNGNHSGVWNIPTSITELPLGWTIAANLSGATGINGGYLGPCPNLITQGNTDKYNLILLALPEASYTVSGNGTSGVRDAYAMLKAEALAEAILSGTSAAVMN